MVNNKLVLLPKHKNDNNQYYEIADKNILAKLKLQRR